MNGLYRLAWLLIFMQMLSLVFPRLQNVYVSQMKGNDEPLCGSDSNPCKTIVMGVWQANEYARIYIDGTGSSTMPYTCKSSSLEFPGINTNKNLEIIGVQSIVHVKCQEGYAIKLDKSDQNETVVIIRNVKFINSTIQAQDISLYITDCVFTDGVQAVNMVQSIRPIIVSFSKSLCVNISSCIVVSVKKLILPLNKISIDVTNSSILTSRLQKGRHSLRASGIHVSSSGDEYNPRSITCDIALKNVTFKHNTIGKYGLIFVDLKNALTVMRLDHVIFLESTITADLASVVSIKNSHINNMILFDTTFYQNYQGFSRAIDIYAKRKSTLYISNSRFEKFNVGFDFGVLHLECESESNVTMKNVTFAGNTGEGMQGGKGGCLSLHSRTATVNVRGSYFHSNRAGCAGILLLNVTHLSSVVIQNCNFTSNTASLGPGGIASIQGREAIVGMVDCKVNGITAKGPGGIFDIGDTGCGTSMDMYNATVVIQGTEIVSSGSLNDRGGIVAIQASFSSIIIQDSTISNVSSLVEGGVICANRIYNGPPYNPEEGYDIKLINSTFSNIWNKGSSGLILYSNGIKRLEIEGSTMHTISSGGTGSTLYLDSTDNASVSLNNTIIKNYSGYGSALTIYITAKVTLTVANSILESSTALGQKGGCMSITIASGDVLFRNVTFSHCVSMSNRKGGAVYLTMARGNVSIISSRFLNNRAETGGAIAFDFLKDEIVSPGCESAMSSTIKDSKHRKWNYKTHVLIEHSFFTNNTAFIGGSLSLSRGNYTIQTSLFVDNFANVQGGHIAMTSDSTSLQIVDSKFVQERLKHVVHFRNRGNAAHRPNTESYKKHKIYTINDLSIGLFISSQSEGPLVILNSTLESRLSRDEEAQELIFISNSNYIHFGENNQTMIICPKGSDISNISFTSQIETEYETRPCKITLIVLIFTCKPCPSGRYSLQHGHSMGLNKVSGFKCLPCPFGAECQNWLKAKPSFWGYKVKDDPPEMNFTMCPASYCKRPDIDDFNFNSCQGNRNGTLCGRCKTNYSETLASSSCRPDDECHDNWLWGVIVSMAMLMAMYLIYKPRFPSMLKRHILWFQCHDNEDDEQDNSGYLKIVFYFYQVANLLLVTTSSDSVIKSYLLKPVVGIFNFQIRFGSSNGFLCPFPGLTAVTKQLLFASHVVGVIFMIAVCYCCHRLLRKCKSLPPPNLGPYLGAVLETLLLGYAVYTTTALKLLRCPSLSGDLRLFIDGSVQCYQWWQYAVMVLAGVVVIPFILTLAFGSQWLYKGTISVKEFLLGCLLPLPYLMYKLVSLFRGPHVVNEEPREWKVSVTSVLYGPFRPPTDKTFSAVYWESILISRKLIIIAIYVFNTDPLTRQLSLVLTCVIILFHHNTVRPFRRNDSNICEMISLFGLIVIATINAFKASFLSIGEDPEGPLQNLMQDLEWVQIVLLIALPVLCIFAVIAAILSQFIRLIIKICSYVTWFMTRDRHVTDSETRLILESSACDESDKRT